MIAGGTIRRTRPSTAIVAAPVRRSAAVRATVYQVNRAETNTSRQVEAIDNFGGFTISTNGSTLLPVPYNVAALFDLISQSSTLPQCIDAYVTNTVLTGWEVDSILRGATVDAGESHELQSFIDHANTEESLIAVMSQVITDRESVGFGFLEVVRDRAGSIAFLRHAKSMFTRMTTRHPTEVLVEQEISRGRRVSYIREYRRFRKFLQMVGVQTVWFKQFGDPRKMDSRTGFFEGEPGYTPGADATEIVHFKLSSNEPYGVPRWVSQVPNIIGTREAEEVNMRYFQDNTVPPMMMMVGNGRLTAASFNELNKTLNSEGVGKNRQNRILLIEAVGEGDSLDGKGSPIDLKIEKLTDTRQSDGLFKEYDQGNSAKVRSSWRLPPVLVGMSQDVNFATATTSVFVAESQVFAPARSMNDELLNNLLINGKRGLGLKTAKLVSRTPSITSPEMVVKTLTAMNVMGAITPRQAQRVTNKMLQLEVDEYPEQGKEGYKPWMDQPIAITAGDQKTHAQQALKDAQTKQVEDDGDVSQSVPKHGEE